MAAGGVDTLAKEWEKVAKKQRLCADTSMSLIDGLIETIENTKAQVVAQGIYTPEMSKAVLSAVKATYSGVSDAHKDLYGALSKYGKAVDKRFKSATEDLDSMSWDPKGLDGPEKAALLDRAVALHFVREGRFELAETFAQEAGVELSESTRVQFQEMYQILESMKEGDLEPAIQWAASNRDQLSAHGSSLEFELTRLKFVQLLSTGKVNEAILYTRGMDGLARFSKSHMKEIQRLMCSILFKSRLMKSPYADLLDPTIPTDLQSKFTADFCLLLGLPPKPPLLTAISIGVAALPTIIKMSSVIKDKADLARINAGGELPIEIPLQDSQRYHSVFTCPVSKEQATEENPPMMMVCGHVVCRDSLGRMSKGNPTSRMKCPYCPTETTAAQAVRVYF